MDIEDFFAEVRKAQIMHPEWRAGQTLFNVLYEHRPDLAEQIRGTQFDPFHCRTALQDTYTNALSLIQHNWNK